MSARDKLAEIISDAENCTDEEGYWALPEDVADAIIAAGWRQPAGRIGAMNLDEAIPTLMVEIAGLDRATRIAEGGPNA